MSPTTQVPRAEYTARHRFARITARKARLVADAIRGKSVNVALETLEFTPKRAASFYKKLVRSAMANASQDERVNVNRLVITDARADDGPMLQSRMRFRPGPQGRAMPFKKLTSHLTIRVREDEAEPDAEKGRARGKKKARGKPGMAPAGAASGAAPVETQAAEPGQGAAGSKSASRKKRGSAASGEEA